MLPHRLKLNGWRVANAQDGGDDAPGGILHDPRDSQHSLRCCGGAMLEISKIRENFSLLAILIKGFEGLSKLIDVGRQRSAHRSLELELDYYYI